MPNIAQSLLSQIDSTYKLCDIFKMFLKQDYEKTIQIFKKYSKLFDKAEWDNVLGDFLEKMMMEKSRLKQIERNQLSSLLSSQYRSKSSSNFRFRNQENDERNYRNYNPESSNLTNPLLQQQMNLQLSSSNSATPLLQRESEYNPLISNSALTSNLINPSLNTESVITTVPSIRPTVGRLSRNKLLPFQEMPMQRFKTGGSKIKLRTFHFLEPKSYNEHAFRAEKPIIAGKMAYDFLRTHYKLKKESSIMFTIEDRIKDRKYNYIGEKVNNKIIIKST
jgi:hypothetical protein